MSNRRHRRPPASVRTYARSYHCTDCPSDIGRPHHTDGVWIVPIRHEPDCPVLAGTIPTTRAGLAAAAAVAESGARVAYLNLDQLENERTRP